MSDEPATAQLETPTQASARPMPPPVVVPRWVQLVALPLGLLALWTLARAAGVVLVVFLVGGVIALILNPLVKQLQRAGLPRGVAVFAVYIGFFVILGGIGVLLANPISDQVTAFQKDVPRLVDSANGSLADLQHTLDRRGIHIQVKRQGQTALETLQNNVIRGSGDVLSFTRDLLQLLVQASLALVLVLVISVYMLLYAEGIGARVRAVMPPGDGTPEDDYPLRVQRAVSSYVRGQLLFSLIMGTSAGVGLWILGVAGVFPDGETYALSFGAFFGLMELIPYAGPVLGAGPPILVALVQDPLTAVWVAIFFLALQQLEGHVVAPQLFGRTLRINPLLVIFALLVGFEIYGIIGALLALPLTAIARETVEYLRRHLVLEPWGTPSAPALAGAVPAPAAACPECARAAAPGDDFCRVCGAELGPGVVARRR